MKTVDYLILPVVLLLALFLTQIYQDWSEKQSSKENLNVIIRQYSRELNKEAEHLDRRLEETNSRLLQLYELLEYLNDYEANKATIRQVYNAHLKYYFMFKTQQELLSQIIESNPGVYLNQELANNFYQLKLVQEKAIEDERAVRRFTESESWITFFVQKVDLTSFDRINQSKEDLVVLRNLILEYIKHIEISFLSLQTVNEKQKELQDLLLAWSVIIPEEKDIEVLDNLNPDTE